MKNGGRIVWRGVLDPAPDRGRSVEFVWVEEAAELTPEMFDNLKPESK